MAVIKPFRGIRYNPARIEQMQTVVSQPYDRIDAALQHRYYDLSPYNIVRIIQGRAQDEDVYARARAYYEQWCEHRVFIREAQPAFYAYEQTFSVDDQIFTRLGMIAAVQLTEFDEGVILPHERTHTGPKEDRLRLLRTLEVNTEQIFMLYPDPENKVNALLRRIIGDRPPDVDVVEIYESDVKQRLWVITDPDVLAAIQAQMAPMRNLIIADGHHRYETALTYRNQQRQVYPDALPNAAFNYITATLVSMDDPGLVILPTHREICHFNTTDPASIPQLASEFFTVEPVDDLETCLAHINANSVGYAFGFYGGVDVGFYVLVLKDERHVQECGSLAVSVLHKLLIEQVAGVPNRGIEDKTMIRYHRNAQDAVDNVNRGMGNFVFFLSPTRMENIKACATRGEKMPQKSTDFYPKVISGLVLIPVNRYEQL